VRAKNNLVMEISRIGARRMVMPLNWAQAKTRTAPDSVEAELAVSHDMSN